MNIHDPNVTLPKVTTGSLPASRKVYRCRGAPDLRVPIREIRSMLRGRAAAAVYDTTGPTPTGGRDRRGKGAAAHAHRVGEGARRIEEYGWQADRAGRNGNVTGKHLARNFPNTPKPWRALDGKPVTQYEFAKAGHITKEMIYVAERENLGRKKMLDRARGRPRRWRAVRRRAARLHHAGIRARRDRARACHHTLQHQPRRTRADDHRPQLPGEDQRQYRQLGRHLLGRGRGREDGVGDPLGRRHGDGPLHRAQHPQHARMDFAQFAGADRHRADLSGAGEGRRRCRSSSTGRSTRTR